MRERRRASKRDIKKKKFYLAPPFESIKLGIYGVSLVKTSAVSGYVNWLLDSSLGNGIRRGC